MSELTRRYAQALYQVCPDEDGLRETAGALMGDAALWEALTSPAVEPEPEPSPEEPEETTPAEPGEPAEGDRGYVTAVSFDAESQVLTLATDHTPEYRVVDLGSRVAIDLLGAVLQTPAEGEVSLTVDSEVLDRVRYSQHGDDLGYGVPHTLRVVLDLQSGTSYTRNLTVEAGGGGVGITAVPSQSSDELPEVDADK